VAIGLAIFEGEATPGGPDPGTRFLCIRNSWGEGWGKGGHALISETVARQSVQVAMRVAPLKEDDSGDLKQTSGEVVTESPV
jgi:C1A family cysteine protease